MPGKVKTVFVILDGHAGEIPINRLGEAIAQGAEPAVQMTDPGGQQGYIPVSRQNDAQKRGFKWTGDERNSVLPNLPDHWRGSIPYWNDPQKAIAFDRAVDPSVMQYFVGLEKTQNRKDAPKVIGSAAAMGAAPALISSLIAAPVATGVSVVGTALGALGAKKVAKLAGLGEEGQDWAELGGALAGGVGAGRIAGPVVDSVSTRLFRGPGGYGEVKSPVGKFPGLVRELESRIPRNEPPTARAEMESDINAERQRRASAHAEMERDFMRRPDELAQAVKEGRASKLPARMAPPLAPKPFSNITAPSDYGPVQYNPNVPAPWEEFAARQAAAKAVAKPGPVGIKESIARPSGRLVLSPEEAQAQDQMQRIAERRASEHGMQYAAGMRPAGGGRVPLTPTSTTTAEFPGPRERVVFPAPATAPEISAPQMARLPVLLQGLALPAPDESEEEPQ